MPQSSKVIQKIKSTFPDEQVNSIAKETGFIQRIRKIKPVHFFGPLYWVLAWGMRETSQISDASMAEYQEIS